MDRTFPLKLGRLPTVAIAAVPVAFLAYFYAYPLASIIWRGLAPDGSVDLGPFRDVLTDPSLRGVAWFTLWQAALSTALTLAAGLPTAYVFARYRFPGRSLVRAIATVPLVLPTLVVGTAFLAVFGPSGALGVNLQGTLAAILIAHVFYNYAIVVRGVGGLWEQLDPSIEAAARTLGASRLRAFWEVTWPLLRPAILSSAAIVFLFSFTSFGVILVLGDLQHATLEVEIWRQTTALLRLDVAAALSVLQLIGVGLLLVVLGRYQRRRSIELPLAPAAETGRRPKTRGERLTVAATLAFMALLLGTPLAVLVVRSFRTTAGFGLGNYTALAGSTQILAIDPVEAIENSLLFALAAVVLAIVVGGLATATVAYSRSRAASAFDAALMLPLGTSAVTIGFGFLVALDAPVDLRTSALLIPIAHALVAIPFVVRSALPVVRAIQSHLREAAATLGASPGRTWAEIDRPIVGKALVVGAAFAFAVSIGEFGATAFIARPDSATIPIAIFRFLGQPGAATFGAAMALSVVLLLLTAAAIVAIERLRTGVSGEF